MKHAVVLPYLDARTAANLAREAEQAGWDGIFVGDAIWCHDPLIQLAAAAMVTERIKLGTMILAMPLRDPRQLASESLALDSLSEGRLILGLATGATWMGWHAFPDYPTDPKSRAEILDETIDILTGMHQSQPFDYDGKHFHIHLSELSTQYYPKPTPQQPRVPLWVPAIWPRMKNMRRALKCDGMFLQKMGPDGAFVEATPQDLCEMKAYVDANRTLNTPFDILAEGKTASLEPAAARDLLDRWAAAGATWWAESTWEMSDEELRTLIRKGPPRE